MTDKFVGIKFLGMLNILKTCFLHLWIISKKKYISEKEHKHFTCNKKNATTLKKSYFLSKIYKRLIHVPGRQVIPNCGTPNEKVWEYLSCKMAGPMLKTRVNLRTKWKG